MTPFAARLAAPAAMSALLFLLLLAAPASATNFTCATVGKTCQSAIGYALPNATTYGDLVTRFNNHDDARGAPGRQRPPRVHAGLDAAGGQDHGARPVPVQDGLDHIARDVFDAFVTYQEIATANNIPDVNLIQVGQKLRIPLPCTCDQVDGADVMHFAYSVAKGDDPPGIAAKFGVTENTLLSVNKITDPKSLMQGQILDVPLPVCQSSISNTSADYNLLVPNGTYVLTADDCIQCKCSASNYEHLDCSPVQGRRCPAVPSCSGGLTLGQANGTDCASRMCAYSGYTNTTSLTLHTSLVSANETACQKGGAARSEFAGSMWRTSIIAFHMALILICLL
ncbi:unnamed protein product [Miscanthus lutarioriparius]|uniref:LysM domain-containing protein n=1 Tax=Miscanthus lutarioriparius TaxID=422564 RepID=A0A811M883_9POAL|nr:unnamed protein product [Miscanthus lutarioriparius]